MAKTKDKGKGKGKGKGGAEKAAKAPKAPRRKGALMDRVTNLVAVLFGVSLVAERLVLG